MVMPRLISLFEWQSLWWERFKKTH